MQSFVIAVGAIANATITILNEPETDWPFYAAGLEYFMAANLIIMAASIWIGQVIELHWNSLFEEGLGEILNLNIGWKFARLLLDILFRKK